MGTITVVYPYIPYNFSLQRLLKRIGTPKKAFLEGKKLGIPKRGPRSLRETIGIPKAILSKTMGTAACFLPLTVVIPNLLLRFFFYYLSVRIPF